MQGSKRFRTAARAALATAIARGLLKPHGGHYAVRRGRRLRVFQKRHVDRFLAEHPARPPA
ncbi:hypothetical protein [Pseudorhodoplanes sp.]|uniref:hypothetical protein n=1 Tax=Pseudorhodoplanes sp. TaxID=1934341 RepID=UPI003D0A0583